MKTALVYTGKKANNFLSFLSDEEYKDFIVLAILSNEDSKLNVYNFSDDTIARINRKNISKTLDVIQPQFVNRFIYKFVDAIFVLDNDNFNEIFQNLISLGVEIPKIIFWNENKRIGVLSFKQPDGSQIICMEGLEFHAKNREDLNFIQGIHVMLQRQKINCNLTIEQKNALIHQIYKGIIGKELNLENPKKFTEKIQWLKLNDVSKLKTCLADKYLVREWIEKRIGKEYLIPLYGVWDSFDDIDFDKLPNQFVLKCNHGSGMNIIVKDKNHFDKQKAKEKINAWLKINYAFQSLELHYKDMERKIIIEKHIDEIDDILVDYKVHCFNGEPKFIQVIGRNFEEHKGSQSNFDFNWNDIGWTFADYPDFQKPPVKPSCLDKIYDLSRILSDEFPYVRVDFYVVEDKILFGEMTFTPASGYYPYKDKFTEQLDIKLGEMLKLPIITHVNDAERNRGGGI